LLNGERFFSLAEAQALIEAWRLHFNAVRPHSALSYRPLAPETIVPHRDAVVLWASALALGSARSPSAKCRHELTLKLDHPLVAGQRVRRRAATVAVWVRLMWTSMPFEMKAASKPII
jgi:hypothetical protein